MEWKVVFLDACFFQSCLFSQHHSPRWWKWWAYSQFLVHQFASLFSLIEFESNWIEFKLYAIVISILSFKWNLILTKSTHFSHRVILTSSAWQCGAQVDKLWLYIYIYSLFVNKEKHPIQECDRFGFQNQFNRSINWLQELINEIKTQIENERGSIKKWNHYEWKF